MDSDSIYELCLPILQDASLEDEDKTDKLESLLEKETTLKGIVRENAIINVLWRFRESNSDKPAASPPPMRHSVLRRPSPAPWQLSRGSTPLASSPGAGRSPSLSGGFGFAPPGFARAISSTASPFTSPRPSPRPAFSSPQIPHSPNLNAYEFPTDPTPAPDVYGGYASDNVDWLVGDDTASNASSLGAAPGGGESSLNGGAAAFSIQPQQVDMSPYDILRSVMGEAKSNEEIERALEANGYDLSAAILSLMGGEQQNAEAGTTVEPEETVLIGKSMGPDPQRPVTPADQQRSGVLCRFWLSTGTCLRADCRFSHDLTNHVCKYWVMGNCLAGDTCIFSHDPSNLVNRLSVEDNSGNTNNNVLLSTPPLMQAQPNFQNQDYTMFPALNPGMGSPEQWSSPYQTNGSPLAYSSLYSNGGGGLVAPPPGFMGQPAYLADTVSQRSHSRPGSRHSQARDVTPSVPSVDDTEAFPTLGAAGGGGKGSGKKHHGKRGGHGHGHRDYKENLTTSGSNNSLADLARMSPTPGPAQLRRMLKSNKSNSAMNNAMNRELSAQAQAIGPPTYIPWLQTSGSRANKAYLKLRQEALKHGGLRNKFLQSAAQAWNRNDARAAKALSLRGQSENDLMRKAHREAARVLYEDREGEDEPTEGSAGVRREREVFVDLHGLHPDEAIEHLARILIEQSRSSPASSSQVPASPRASVTPSAASTSTPPPLKSKPRVIYIVTSTTSAPIHHHHTSTSKDKTSRVVRAYLNEHHYVWRDFAVATNGAGGGIGPGAGSIIGVDTSSGDPVGHKAAVTAKAGVAEEKDKDKVKVLASAAEGNGGVNEPGHTKAADQSIPAGEGGESKEP